MTDQMTQVQKFFEDAAQVTTKAYEIQAKYGQDYINRMGLTAAQFADNFKNHLTQLGEIKDPKELMDSGVAYQNEFVAKLQEVATENQGAFEQLQSEIKDTFAALNPTTAS